MTPEQTIYHRALRCRPCDAEKYKHVHMALAGAVSLEDEFAFMKEHYSVEQKKYYRPKTFAYEYEPPRITLFSRLINAMSRRLS